MALPHLHGGDALANISSSDSEARDSGDLLNGIGSTSSLASTVSSVFSANVQAASSNSHMSALTPLTHPASSPVKSASPHPSTKPHHASNMTNPSPLGLSAADTPRGPSENATPRSSPPRLHPRIMPPSGQAKGYRAVWDPELDNKLGKEEKKRAKVKTRSFGTESHCPDPPPDPRLAIVGYTAGKAVPSHIQSKTKMRVAPYVLKPYVYDQKTTIGPSPPKQVVVHGFDPFTPDSQLKTFFSGFGDISELRNHTDPNTGSFLGICSIKYRDSRPVKGVSVSAANCAKRAEKEANNERLGLTTIKVERDREGRKCKRYIEFKLKRAKQELEKEVARRVPRVASLVERPPSPVPITPSNESPAPPVNAPKGPSGKRAPVPPPPPPPLLEQPLEKPQKSHIITIESEPVLDKIKRKPYIFISRDTVPVLASTVPHLKKRFKSFEWKEVRVDKSGYYVIFDDSKWGEDETVRCFKECNNGPLFNYFMNMECQQYGNPNYERSPSPETQAVQKRERAVVDRLTRWEMEDLEEEKKQRAVDLDPVKGALEQLQSELRAKIMDDIKTRLAIPTLYDCLDPARHVAKRQKLDLPDPMDNENKPPALLLNKASEASPGALRNRNGRALSQSKPLRPHDPNRGRGVSNNVYIDERRKQRPPPRPVHSRPLHYRLQQMFPDDDDDEDSDDERRTSMTRDTEDQESRPMSRASRTSTPFNDAESVDLQTPRHKKRKLVHKQPTWEPDEEQEVFGPLQKELLGDLLQKDPEVMATRELELVVNTLPRTSNFQKRAKNELFIRQRAKYDDDLFRTKTGDSPAQTPAPAIEITKADGSAATPDVTMADSGDLAVKPAKERSKRKRKSKKQIFEEREAMRAAARAAEGSEAMDEDIISQMEEKEAEIEGADEVIDESGKPQVEWAASTDEPRKTVGDDGDAVLDIDGWQHVLKDDEDMRFLQKALEDESAAEIGDTKLWAWKQKEIKTLNVYDAHGTSSTEAKIRGYYVPNPTGCARTEGVKKILESEKSKYLPHRIRVQKQREEREAQAKENPNAAADAAKATAAAKLASTVSSRSNRANNRRLINDINLQKQNLSTTGAETDAIRFNQLKKRKKLVKFDRSAIHGWGLYAMENIAFNDLIIEYVGEKVRQKVADLREQKYDKQGIGSSYLFRMVDDEIVDATKKGGIARFINHSCTPNCTARIIKVEGTRRIVIYALKDIAKNEELTYDYKFEREYGSEDRIPCLCGSVGCKGFLN